MAKVLQIDPANPEEDALSTVAHEIIHGRLIICPTDTLYGIGADACNPDAVERVFDVKKRDRGKPLLILVNSVEMAIALVQEVSEPARALIEKFWPGPLTLVFRAASCLTSKLTGGTGTIGIRYPQHAFCLKVLERCHRPMTSTSANISGHERPSSIKEIVRTFESAVDLIVDAGDSSSTQPSTVVDVTARVPRVVREGAVKYELLRPYITREGE